MRLKNTSGGSVDLPTLDLRVPDGDEVDVTGDDAKNLLASGLFERTDKPSKNEKE
jgi:hypothetical protein